METNGQTCNYAAVQSENFYINLLRNKLVEEVEEFLASNDVAELIDIQTVLNAMLDVAKVSQEDFQKAYNDKLTVRGGFEKRYVGFFPDPTTPSRATKEMLDKAK